MSLHDLAIEFVSARLALRSARANRNRLKCEEAYYYLETGDSVAPCWKDQSEGAEMCATCVKRTVAHNAFKAASERAARTFRKLMREGQKAESTPTPADHATAGAADPSAKLQPPNLS